MRGEKFIRATALATMVFGATTPAIHAQGSGYESTPQSGIEQGEKPHVPQIATSFLDTDKKDLGLDSVNEPVSPFYVAFTFASKTDFLKAASKAALTEGYARPQTLDTFKNDHQAGLAEDNKANRIPLVIEFDMENQKMLVKGVNNGFPKGSEVSILIPTSPGVVDGVPIGNYTARFFTPTA